MISSHVRLCARKCTRPAQDTLRSKLSQVEGELAAAKM